MKPTRLSLRYGLLVSGLVVLTVSTTARANDPAAADALFQAGKQLVTEKKFAEACTKFDASYKLDPTLGTLLNLADCYEKAGRYATSWTTWGSAIERAQRDKDDRLEYAKERRDALAPKLPKVVIRVYGMLPGIDVYWDNFKMPPGAFGSDIPTEVLRHKLVVRRDDGAVLLDRDIEVHEDGKKTEIPIDVIALNRAHPRLEPGETPPTSTTPRSTQANVALAIGGVGAAALLTAGGLELGALLKRNEARDAGACVGTYCTPQGVDAIESARTYAEAGQWIGLGGLVLFSVGTTLYLATPSPSTSNTPTAKVGTSTNRNHPTLWWTPWAGPSGAGFVLGGAL